ncbi:MAG: hypothetical protein ACRDDZ_00825 [Marinifilaceae bacterium]
MKNIILLIAICTILLRCASNTAHDELTVCPPITTEPTPPEEEENNEVAKQIDTIKHYNDFIFNTDTIPLGGATSDSRSFMGSFITDLTEMTINVESKNHFYITFKGVFSNLYKNPDTFQEHLNHYADTCYYGPTGLSRTYGYMPHTFSDLIFTSDADFDDTHPKGTALNDIMTILSLQAGEYIKAGYIGDPYFMGNLATFNSNSTLLLWNRIFVRFHKFPTRAGTHTFTVQWTIDSKTWTKTLNPIFMSKYNAE